MGFSQSSSRSPSARSTPSTLAEINVTPLVDVMLVLLIVFMISAPLMQQGIQVDLPKTKASAVNDSQEPVILAITQDRKVLIGSTEVEPATLAARLEAIAQARPDVELHIQGDRNVPYGFVAQIMAEVKRSRISKVGLITDPSEK
jgi:biopolymer transport protein TolR